MNPKDYIMPFGKFKGMRLHDISADEDGLRYLDWAAGKWDGPVVVAIRAYLAEPAVKAAMDRIFEEDEG